MGYERNLPLSTDLTISPLIHVHEEHCTHHASCQIGKDTFLFPGLSQLSSLSFASSWLGNKKEVLGEVDFIICVGGDGTLLYTSSMFQVGPCLLHAACTYVGMTL